MVTTPNLFGPGYSLATLGEVARIGEAVAIGMAARAGTVGQVLRSLGPISLGAAAIGALWPAFAAALAANDTVFVPPGVWRIASPIVLG